MKNNNQELDCQRLDYVKFYNNAIQSKLKIIQVGEFNINRRTVSYIKWIKKRYPAFILQEVPAEKYRVLADISNTLILVINIETERKECFNKIKIIKNMA